MKIALIGDVHANLIALQSVLSACKKHKIKQIINVGDFVGYGAEPNEVIEIIKNQKNIINIIGNYDLKVLKFPQIKNKLEKKIIKEKFIAFKFAYEHLTDENKTFLTELPREYRTEINGYKLLAVHGSPDTIEEHLSKDTPKKRFIEIAKNADADIIVSGHSHNFFTKKINNVLFVNTGSVGRQNDGNPEAEYVILNILRNKIKINNYRVKYDINKTIETIKKNGLPEIFCEMIKCGRSLDYLLDEKLLNSNYLEKAQAFGEKYNYEYEHSQQVRKLSLILFDKLKCLHNLGAVERLYLECAALLHDIGFYYGSKKHNKHSFNMILENEELPFTEKQKLMIALIARYHRKKMPNEKKHKYFAALGKTDREIVKKTAALLRIADGLDVTHNNTVADIECKIKNNKVIIKCISDKDLALERCQALKKSDLFVLTFRKKIQFI